MLGEPRCGDEMAGSGLRLGIRRDDRQPVELPTAALLRHVMALGSSGSGKTVFCKVVVEELLSAGLPAICVDPQGDLCSLVAAGDPDVVARHGLDPALVEQFRQLVDPVIFTPASRKGVPLCADPVERGIETLESAERMQAYSRTATMIVSLLGYEPESDDGAGLAAVLDTLLTDLANEGRPADSLGALADHLARLADQRPEHLARYLDTKKLKTACQRLARLDVGARRLLFHDGIPIDIDLLLGRRSAAEPPPGKVRLSIVYLNTLHGQDDKDFFVAALTSRLYGWMLKNPSREPQALFYLDEVAPFLPPVRKPAAKDPLLLLFKQARKYGVCCLMATQNPGDVDYKAMAQFGTWVLGRTTTRQDLKKLAPTIKSLAPTSSDAVLDALPSLKPGEFVMLSPDHFEAPCPLDVRWLLTRHETYDEERIAELTDAGWRERFAGLDRTAVEPAPVAGSPQTAGATDPAPQVPIRRPVTRTAPLPAVTEPAAVQTAPMPVPPTVPMPVVPPPVEAAAPPTPPTSSPTGAPVLVSPAPTPPAPLAAPSPPAVAPAPLAAPSPLAAAPAPLAAPSPLAAAPPAVDPRRAELEKYATVLSRRRAMSTSDFTQAAGCGERKARSILKELVEARLARTYKEGRTPMYWAVSTGNRPDLGLSGRVRAVMAHVDERGARHIAQEHARGKLLGLVGRDEAFERAELTYRLVYQLDFEEKVERPLLGGLLGSRQDQLLGSVYVHPRTLQLLVFTVHGGIVFSDKPADHASDVADFDGVAQFVEAAPGDLPIDERDWAERREPAVVKRELKKRYAVSVGKVTPVFVPAWRLVLRTGTGTGYRVVHVDALTGRTVSWP